jgi:hypothetical protein
VTVRFPKTLAGRWRGATRGLALASYGVLLWVTSPAWPDDWDGIGFVESVRDFDVGSFRPHPPGYPVYVALLRVAAAFVSAPMQACVLVAVASALVAVAFVWAAARRAAGERAAWMTAILTAIAPGVWRACTGVGSEAPAFACAAACVWGLLASRPAERGPPRWGSIALGIGAGLGLGVRLSWAPIYLGALAVAPRGSRLRAWTVAGAACLAWAAPFVAWQGPRRLVVLYAEHFAGHSARWGGTIVTQPGNVRLGWLARDLFIDGEGMGSDSLGLVIGALVAMAGVQALIAWRATGARGAAKTMALVLPYAVWIGIGQNLRDQPRHVLPLVALVAAGMALPVAVTPAALPVACALAMALSVRTAADAHARRAIPPAGQQLVDLARVQPSPNRLAVFGGASARFFETTELAANATAAGSLGDVQMDLTRVDNLPTRVWVTSEIGGAPESPSPLILPLAEGDTTLLEPVANLCRPPRIDRRMPCLGVFAWRLPFLPSR